jgi:hypothetical protein
MWFSDLRHPEAFVFFVDRAHYEKNDLAPQKGLLLGVFLSAEGPQDEGVIDKEMLRILSPARGSQDEDVI